MGSRDVFTIVPSDAGDAGVAMGPLGMVYAAQSVQAFDRLYVGSAGNNINLLSKSNTTVLLEAVPIGELNIGGKRVLETNTTSTKLVGIVE